MSGKRVKRKVPEPPVEEKPTKTEYAVAKYIRDNVPNKKTKFMHHPVMYFTAGRAVDALLDSPWASGEKKQPILFTDRQSVVDFLDLMLRHKFFHRAKKIAITDRDLRRKELKKLKKKEEEEKKKPKDESESESGEDEEAKEAAERSAADEPAAESGAGAADGDGNASSSSPRAKKKKGQEPEEGKPKRRVKLDMHLEQLFVDGNDAYVWIYDPIPTHYWLLGILLVLAIVAVCLFPLWPAKVREYVYYLSLAAAGFLVFILALSVIRVVVFAAVWLVTMGRHHLWVLPNLTEDVGFFASFWPLYQYEYRGPKDEKKKEKRKKKKETTVEGEGGNVSASNADDKPAATAAADTNEGDGGQAEDGDRGQEPDEHRESEGGGSEGSQQSTGSFEILDRSEEPDPET